MAQKKLNKNVVAGLTLFTFATVIVLSALMLRSLERRDPKHLVQLAEGAASQEDWHRAGSLYVEAFRARNEAGYLVPAGEMLLREGSIGEALRAWNQALVLQPDLIDAHKKLIALRLETSRLYGTTDEWEQARVAAQALIDVSTAKSADVEAFARHALGLALIALEVRDPGSAERGRDELRRATELSPDEVEYAVDLGAEYSRAEKLEEAEAVFRAQLERHAGADAAASKARTGWAGHLARRRRFDEATSAYKESIASAGEDVAARGEAELAYAAFLAQQWALARADAKTRDGAQRYLDEAEGVLKGVMQRQPDSFKAYLQLAVLYKVSTRHVDAVGVCEKRLSRGFSRKGVEAGKTRVDAFTLMIYASESCVALAAESAKTGDLARRDEQLTKADQYVADARGEATNHPRILSQAGRVKLARGQDRAAIEDLRAADDGYRSFSTVNWENRMLRASTHLRLNEAGAARAVLEEVVPDAMKMRTRDTTFWNLYAQSLLQTNELEKALGVVDRVLMVDPRNSDATLIKAAVYERQNKPELAGEIHAQLTGSTTVRAMLRARAASMEGKNEEATRILLEAVQTDSSDVRLVGMAVNELVTGQRYDEAAKVVASALEAKPDDLSLRQLAVYVRRDLSPEERDRATLEIIAGETDAFQRALDLVMFRSRQNDAAAALKAVDEALGHLRARATPAAAQATSAQHHALLKAKVRLAGQLQDHVAMDSAREESASFNVDGAGGKTVLALVHVQRGEIELAINALREAIAVQSTDASSLALLGQCYHSLGRTEDAKGAYERAVAANREEGYAHQGLAVLALARGDQETFDRELTLCERLLPSEPWVQEQSSIRLENSDPKGAIVRREQTRQQSPDDVPNLQRLAALYEAVGDRTKADAAYERLLQLKPEDDRVVAAAALHRRRTQRPQEAVEIIQAAIAQRTDAKSKSDAQRLLAAEYLGQSDRTSAERALLESAQSGASAEVERALAEFYLRTADDPKKALPWYDRAVERARMEKDGGLPGLLEARIVCRLHRDLNDVDRASKDVEELRRDFKDVGRGMLWESEIHARRGDIERAIAALAAYLAVSPDDAYALYQRARYRVSQGAIPAAIEDLQNVKRINPQALRYEPRVLLARLERRQGREDLWISELEALAREAPDSPTAIAELADTYVKVHRFDDADRMLTAQINRDPQHPDPRWFFLRGTVSVEVKQNDRALRDFRQAAEFGGYAPEYVARVLELYASLEQFAEGVTYFEKIKEKVADNPVVKGRYARLMVKSGRTGEGVATFRQAMAQAMATLPDAASMVGQDATLAFAPEEGVTLLRSAVPEETGLRRANDRLLVRLLSSGKRYDEASGVLDLLSSSASNDRERAALLQEKGDILQLAGRVDEAVIVYEQVLSYAPKNWVTLNNLAYLLSDRKSDNQRALPHALQAVRAVDNAITLDTLGWIYVGLGNYPAAIAELTRAIRQDDEYAWAYYHLGEAYRRSGQFSDAGDVLATGRNLARSGDEPELIAKLERSIVRTGSHDAAP
ncbi:MAG: tetratricopeptide repeat protein [Planctomycetota bacterium]